MLFAQAAQIVKQVHQGAGGLTNGNHDAAQNGGLVNGSQPGNKGVSPQKAAGNQGGQKQPAGVSGSTLLALQQKVDNKFYHKSDLLLA